MRTDDAQFVAQVIEVAGRAREHGNPPYGALLVDGEGRVLLEEENTTVSENDITAHPELKVAKLAAQRWDATFLAGCTMYASTEPCAMCTSALYNAGIGRVVFAMSGATSRALRGNPPTSLAITCREVLSHGGRPVEVVGPVDEDAALVNFEGLY
jgi:tRNA(Arg) A34 adenosine deaminase TadA